MPRITGASLAKSHGMNVKHSLYRKTGDWYHVLRSFPAVLFDENGYVYFDSQQEYDLFLSDDRIGVNQNATTDTLTIKNGISSYYHYVLYADRDILAEEISNSSTVIEGAKRQITVNSYERNSQARVTCIKKWGLDCSVCKFNFEAMFGDIGKGFIHVHHLTLISSIKEEYLLNPMEDMRPVCPNCHAMLHRRNPPLSIDELRTMLKPKAQKK